MTDCVSASLKKQFEMRDDSGKLSPESPVVEEGGNVDVRAGRGTQFRRAYAAK